MRGRRSGGEATWAPCHGRTCRRVRTGTSSTRCTACTTRPAGRACGSSPARPAAVPPPSRLSSRRRGCRPGGCWSCWSRRWTATSRSSVRCGRRPGHRSGLRSRRPRRRPGSPVGSRSWRPSADTSPRATPGLLLVTGEAGIGKTRLVDTAGAVASGSGVRGRRYLPPAVHRRAAAADRHPPAGDVRRGPRAVAEGGADRRRAVRVRVLAAAAPRAGPDRGRARRAGRRVVAAAALHRRRLDAGRAGRPAAAGRRHRGPALGGRDDPRPARAPADHRSGRCRSSAPGAQDDPTVPVRPSTGSPGYAGCPSWTSSRWAR